MSLLENKKAYFNYQIEEKLEAGLQLLGLEVKSLRAGQGSLEGSYVIVRGGEAYLVGSTIPAYQVGNTPASYDPARSRKLLMTKEEIAKLAGLESRKGLTVVPLKVYNKGNKLKLEVGIARGKKKHDKRRTLEKRDANREMERSLKTGT